MELSSFTPLFSILKLEFVASFIGGGCMVSVEVDFWRPGWIDTRSGKYYWSFKGIAKSIRYLVADTLGAALQKDDVVKK